MERFVYLDHAQPLAVAYGLGVDSTAALVGLRRLNLVPHLIMFADTGNEKQETYDYLPVINEWLTSVGFPQVTVVRKVVKDFKHWPPYYSLGENCLTNGTLPSLAFGFKSCSLKWKVYPQDQFCKRWTPAVNWWKKGGKVAKIIGYDNSAKDRKRYAQALDVSGEDPRYDYWYPLIEWGWDRERCKVEIQAAGLPVPPKSACYFCPATQPEELHELKKVYLRYIVVMEARARPRLEKIEGLWRNGVKGTKGGKAKPGRMTQYIMDHGLLPAEEVEKLEREAPKEIVDKINQHALGLQTPAWHDFIEAFTPEDGLDEIPLPGRVPLPVVQPW
jgi:hypothetical protein